MKIRLPGRTTVQQEKLVFKVRNKYKHVQLFFYKETDILESRKDLYQFCDVCNTERCFERLVLHSRKEKPYRCISCGSSWP